MKTFPNPDRNLSPSRQAESGMAVILVMALLAIILVYVAGNLGTLHHVSRELRLIEQKQVRRLESISATNLSALTATNEFLTSRLEQSQAADGPRAPSH
jgi:hypothetical protein